MSRIKIIELHSWLDGQLQYNPARANECGMKGEEARGFYPDGAKKFSYPLVNGKLHGVCQIWYQDGRLKREEVYENGLLHGVVREWYQNSNIELEQHYNKGRKEGTARLFNENGQIISDCTYRDDVLHGEERKWFFNGKLSFQCSYQFGLRHGKYINYAESGKIIEQKIYVRGIVLAPRVKKMLDSGTLTGQMIMRFTNVGIRRLLLEEFGYERFLKEMPHEILDRSGEQELVKIDWNKREEPIHLVKVRCSTTGVFYTLRVPPAMKTVKEAVAWTFGMSEGEYAPEKES